MTAGVLITKSILRRCLDVRTTSFFLIFPNTGKKCIGVVLREKYCKRTKTVGSVKVALIRGLAENSSLDDNQRIVGGILIFAEDITRRKQLEQAISEMTKKLIESQEQERTRIAREIHDDIAQRLALLAVELEQLHKIMLVCMLKFVVIWANH